MNETDKKILSMLPERFTKKQADEVVRLLGLSNRYFECFTRKKVFKSIIVKSFHGVYRKL